MLALRQLAIPGDGPLGPGRLNGIGVSRDGRTIWVTLTGEIAAYPGLEGAVLEMPAFGGSGA